MDSTNYLVTVSLILAERDSCDLGPMLLNYVENVKKIGGPDWASFCRTWLQSLDQHLESLNHLRQANIFVVVDNEVARARVELHLLQEELKKKEEVCAQELHDLANA